MWNIADKLYGGVEGWAFRGYTIGTMFYHYISRLIIKEFVCARQIDGEAALTARFAVNT